MCRSLPCAPPVSGGAAPGGAGAWEAGRGPASDLRSAFETNEAGVVDGKLRGNTTSGYLSLASTISSFEDDGLPCTIAPVYHAKDEKQPLFLEE